MAPKVSLVDPPTAIYAEARAAGFSPAEAIIATAIALAESGGNRHAHNPNAATGDDSYGWWQINMLGQMGADRRRTFGLASNDQLYAPAANARVARAFYLGSGWQPWSVWKSGAYRAHLPEAQAAAAAVGGHLEKYRVAPNWYGPDPGAVLTPGLADIPIDIGKKVAGAAGGLAETILGGARDIVTKGAFVAAGLTLAVLGGWKLVSPTVRTMRKVVMP